MTLSAVREVSFHVRKEPASSGWSEKEGSAMKRFLAIMLAAMLVLCSSLAAFAEDTNSSMSQPRMTR